MINRIPAFVKLLVVGIASAEVPLGKPQLFGGVIEAAHVEEAVMLHQAVELVGPFPRYPVHHVTAIAGTHRACPVAVDLGILLQCRRKAQLEVFERLASPVAIDAVVLSVR